MLRVPALTALAGVPFALASPAAATVSLSVFGSGYSAPVFLTGRANTVYVVQQGGAIIAVDRSTKARSTFFTVPDIETGGEKGLLGFAFDPYYKTNGRFYVNVTARVGGQLVTQVRRYTDPSIKAEASQIVIQFNQPFDNHNGGWIDFGRDKNLYIATGDGGSGNDPGNNAQNLASPLGKILRVNVQKDAYPADPLKNYAIPTGNPFGTEVFAYGLRNPYRDSFDRTTGDLWIGDVGQGRIEEVDRIALGTSGQNFGWRPKEGPFPTPGVGDPIPPGTVDPTYYYTHDAGDNSITGGYVYRGGRIGDLDGKYVFADFVSGRIWSMNLDGTGVTDIRAVTDPFGGRFNISSFGEDGSKALYVLGYGGTIYALGGSRLASGPAGASLALAAVPEPANWALLIAGFGLVGGAARRRRAAPRASAGA